MTCTCAVKSSWPRCVSTGCKGSGVMLWACGSACVWDRRPVQSRVRRSGRRLSRGRRCMLRSPLGHRVGGRRVVPWNKHYGVRAAGHRASKPPQKFPNLPVTLLVLVRSHMHHVVLADLCSTIYLREHVVLLNMKFLTITEDKQHN